MSKHAVIVLALLFALSGSSTISAPNPPNPLHESELLALVAGNALPEVIVTEIRSRGLAFTLDSTCRSYLKTAGAADAVLAAFDSAKRNPPSPAEKPNAQILQHLSAAGKLIRAKKFDAAANELKWLAMNAVANSDLPSAEKFLNRALEINRKAYGEEGEAYSEMLRMFAVAYMAQQKLDKAEPYLMQAAGVEKLYDYDPRYAPMSTLNLWQLCSLYEAWGKPEKLDSCDRRLISAFEKDHSHTGEQSLAMVLTREAKTLRTLDRPDDAAKIEERLKSLGPAAANNPNQ